MAVFDHLPNSKNVFLLATWFPVAIADTQSKILRCLKHQPLDYHKYIEILLTGMCTSLSLSLFIVPFHFHTQVCVHHQDQLSCTCSKYLVSTRRRRLIVSILIIIHDRKKNLLVISEHKIGLELINQYRLIFRIFCCHLYEITLTYTRLKCVESRYHAHID